MRMFCLRRHFALPLLGVLLLSIPAQAQQTLGQQTPMQHKPVTVPKTQQEQMYDPKPLVDANKAALVARGRSVLIRPGLRKVYITEQGQPRVVADTGQEFILERGFNALTIRPLPREAELILPPRDVIPEGKAGRGQRNIQESWLIQPTDRYDHGALGDKIEAGALRVVTPGNHFAVFRLTDGSVFEGLQPTIGDVDGDGTEEVLVVNSTVQEGSALQVYKIAGEGARIRLELMAEGPRTGRKDHWINPVGIGDFDLDGRPEIAAVDDPDGEGTLIIYHVQGGRLQEMTRMAGFSNHAPGVPQTGMSLIRDITGDNRPDLIVPNAIRDSLRIMTLDKGKLIEIGMLRLPSPVKTDILWLDDGLTFGLEDNSVLSLSIFIQ